MALLHSQTGNAIAWLSRGLLGQAFHETGLSVTFPALGVGRGATAVGPDGGFGLDLETPGWSDGGRSSDSKDFLAWAKRAIWRNENELFPLFRLGRASCGVSLVAGSSDARDVARQMQAEGLLVRDSVGWRRLQRWPNLSGNASFCQIVTCSCTTCFCSPQALSHLSNIGTTIQTCAQPPQRQKDPTPAQEVQHLSQQLSWATLWFYMVAELCLTRGISKQQQ